MTSVTCEPSQNLNLKMVNMAFTNQPQGIGSIGEDQLRDHFRNGLVTFSSLVRVLRDLLYDIASRNVAGKLGERSNIRRARNLL